jgi:ribose 5-phosphate isomerase B
MRIAVAADHGGFPLKQAVLDELRALGHEALDLGTDSAAAVDYPDFAQAVGEAIQRGDADRGIVICGSGVGASVAANKLRGIRAAVAHDTYSAHQGVEHDDMNVLAIGARVIGPAVAVELVRAFTGAKFSGEERHARRLNKVLAIEERSMPKEKGNA